MSLIDIRKKLGPIYANIEKNPVLKTGLLKPGLKAACVNYDRKIDACEAILKRQKELPGKLQAFVTILDDCKTKNDTLKAERDKAHTANATLFTTAATGFNEAKAKGDKADPADVVKKVSDLIGSFKKVVDEDKVHADKKEKLGADVVADLKKNGDAYEKESKEIDSAVKTLTTDGKNLEAQVRTIVVSYQAAAKKSTDPKLKADLTKLQTDLETLLEALTTIVV